MFHCLFCYDCFICIVAIIVDVITITKEVKRYLKRAMLATVQFRITAAVVLLTCFWWGRGCQVRISSETPTVLRVFFLIVFLHSVQAHTGKLASVVLVTQ